MLIKIGTFTVPEYNASGYDIDLETNDYDTIIVLSSYRDQADASKAGIGISSILNDRSAYGSDYTDTLAQGDGKCLHGTNGYFSLKDDGKTLHLGSLNIAWVGFPSYYFLLKLGQNIQIN